ncbi:hypothetical protein Dimus_014852 [Dionaea muscipula]
MIRQIRVKLADIVSEPGRSTEGKKVSAPSAQSFADRKPPRWFAGQLFGQMSSVADDYNEIDNEYAAAVAAAAYAINSLEFDTRDREDQPRAETTAIPSSVKSKRWDMAPEMTENRGNSKPPYTDEATSGLATSRVNQIIEPNNKPIRHLPSMEKTITFADNKQSMELPSTGGARAKPVLPSAMQLPPEQEPAFQQETQVPGGESQIDVWERAEMAKIKQRFDRLSATIVEWEDEKKKKAERRLNRRETELERNRANAVRYYRDDMERINQIAQGARAQAMEKQRNEELKVKEKAQRFRTTGELPTRCSCF